MVGAGRGRPPFDDRQDAGERLGTAVADVLAGTRPAAPDPVVLGLPRGGVILAAEVAAAVGAPVDVAVVRKLGHPCRPELGLGAIAEDGVRVLNHALIARLDVSQAQLDEVTARERTELDRRAALFRGDRRRARLAGRTAIVVDDGLATGYTALAAVESARRRGAARLVVAVPVGAPEAVALLRPAVDDLVCLAVPGAFEAVGQAYRSFAQVPDDQVLEVLRRCRPAET